MPDENVVSSWPRLVRDEDLLVWAGQMTDRLRYGAQAPWMVSGSVVKLRNPNWTVEMPPGAAVDWANITGKPTTFPPGGAAGKDLSGTYPDPTVVKSSGDFTVNGKLTTTGTNTDLGSSALITRLVAATTVFEPRINAPFAAQDTTKAGWAISHYIDANDAVVWWHRTAGAAANTGAELMRLRGSDGRLQCNLADRSVSRAQITMTGTVQSSGMNASGPAVNITPANQWIVMLAAPTQSFAGTQYVTVIGTFDVIHLVNATFISYFAIFIDGGEACRQQINSGTSMVNMAALQWVGQLAAGNHSFDMRGYQNGTLATSCTNMRLSVLVH